MREKGRQRFLGAVSSLRTFQGLEVTVLWLARNAYKRASVEEKGEREKTVKSEAAFIQSHFSV